MWNFKGTLWNSTQNILPIHWKIWFLCNIEILRGLRFKSSYAFLKRTPRSTDTMVTLWHGNVFHITVWRDCAGHRWITSIRASNTELPCFCAVRLNKLLNKHSRCRRFKSISLKWKCCNFDEILITGYLRCGQRWKFCQMTSFLF